MPIVPDGKTTLESTSHVEHDAPVVQFVQIMIKELNDLIHFIKSSVWRDEELLAFFSKNNADIQRLYQVIWNNNYPCDAAAARAAGVGLTTYKKHARGLRKQLQQMTIFFDAEKAKVDATLKNYVDGTLEVALLNLLQVRGYRHAPLSIAKRLHRRGRDYDMPAFVAEALCVMKESVLSVGGTAGQFEKYADEYWKYRRYAEAEARAADCFQRSKLPYLQKKGQQQDLHIRTRECLESLRPFKWETPSYLFHVYYFVVQGNYLLETADFENALANYDEAIRYFQTKRYPVKNALAMFFYSKVPPCILLGRYDVGEAAVLASLDHAPNGSFNFFNACEMYFYLSMHAGKYAQALEIYQTCTQHRRFANLRAPQKENWHILGAYIFIFHKLNGWPWPENSIPVFRSFRFANQTPTYGQDKTGMNAAIQIAITLLLLLEGRNDDVIERIEALDKYRSRYLKGWGADRSGLFIQMLIQLPRANFQAKGFLQKTKSLKKRLAATPPRHINQHYELEIIPFEMLFDVLVAFLQKNGKRASVAPAKYNIQARINGK